VLGSGVVGLSVARELARRSIPTTVIERERPVDGTLPAAATGASLGVLSSPRDGRSALRRLLALGERTYPDLARRLAEESGVDLRLQDRGSLRLVAEMPAEAERSKQLKPFLGAGGEASWIGESELRRLAPVLFTGGAPVFRAALHVRREAIVDPRVLWKALRGACERFGAVFLEGAGEARLESASRGSPSGELEIVLPSGERLGSGGIVVAAGCWSAIAARVAPVPVAPVRGQAIEVRFHWDACPNLRFDAPSFRREYHVTHRGQGLAWIGSTVEDGGFDAEPTPSGLAELLDAGRLAIPDLAVSDVVRHWAGLRPRAMRPGGPLLGPLPGSSNVWVACGHYRSGILTGPASAGLLVRRILGEPPLEDAADLEREAVQAFRVDR